MSKGRLRCSSSSTAPYDIAMTVNTAVTALGRLEAELTRCRRRAGTGSSSAPGTPSTATTRRSTSRCGLQRERAAAGGSSPPVSPSSRRAAGVERADRAAGFLDLWLVAVLVRRGAGRDRRSGTRLRRRLRGEPRARAGGDGGAGRPDGADHHHSRPQRRLRRPGRAPPHLRRPPGRDQVLLQRRQHPDGALPQRPSRPSGAASFEIAEDGYAAIRGGAGGVRGDPVPPMLHGVGGSLERFASTSTPGRARSAWSCSCPSFWSSWTRT